MYSSASVAWILFWFLRFWRHWIWWKTCLRNRVLWLSSLQNQSDPIDSEVKLLYEGNWNLYLQEDLLTLTTNMMNVEPISRSPEIDGVRTADTFSFFSGPILFSSARRKGSWKWRQSHGRSEPSSGFRQNDHIWFTEKSNGAYFWWPVNHMVCKRVWHPWPKRPSGPAGKDKMTSMRSA